MTLFPLYAVVDQETATRHGWTVPDLAQAYLAGGARLLQVRLTQGGSAQFLEWCDEIVTVARSYGAHVVVNNRWDIAMLSGASGVHVGQQDLGVGTVRRMISVGAFVGLSTHSITQVLQSMGKGASYVAVGPTYGTKTKDTGYATTGLRLVREASHMQPKQPVVAIGGITLARVPDVLQAGATSVAVISDLLVGGDPKQRVRDYISVLGALLQ